METEEINAKSTQTSNNIIENVSDFALNNHQIESIYMGVGTYYSIVLDLISLYLKGQKLLYTESKTFCEMVLYCLMLPAIFISSACTVLNAPLKSVKNGATVVSALNGFNSFLLAFVTYVKLDAKAEAHKTSAYQFDKLQSACEFYSGKAQLIPDKDIGKKVYEFIETIEKKVGEIKDANQFSLPEVIRYRYNHIYSYNIFAMMKKDKTKRSLHIQRLINITNVIKERQGVKTKDCTIVDVGAIKSFSIEIPPKRSFFSKKEKSNQPELDIYDPNISLQRLLNERDKYIQEIIEYRDMSIGLTQDYNDESEQWIKRKQNEFFAIFNWLKI
uniref:Uncharacterized protein n=1 Tax=viral metagenome TaxID=1070528 RepID=A0A6C0B0B0_9ZZZZ